MKLISSGKTGDTKGLKAIHVATQARKIRPLASEIREDYVRMKREVVTMVRKIIPYMPERFCHHRKTRSCSIDRRSHKRKSGDGDGLQR